MHTQTTAMSEFRIKFDTTSDIIKPSNKQRNEATEIVEENANKWNYIEKTKRPGTLVTGELVRLDLQGLFDNKDQHNRRYANMQIQLNATKMAEEHGEEADTAEVDKLGKPKSTTIACVLMPADVLIPEDIWKNAFNGSLNGNGKATIYN